jgi:epoxyqueuosine reductase
MTVFGEDFKRRLAAEAARLGCVGFGVAPAAPLPAAAGRLRAWLDRGWHADMGYLARSAEERADPRRLLPGARSALVVAVPYGPQPEPDVPEPAPAPAPAARLAQQFRGRDYHRVVHAILEGLVEHARRAGAREAAFRPACDTRPLLERSLAVRAGLGTIGHHTQLLIPGHGSMAALGVLLTDLALPPDDPLTVDPCGSCDACLRACPTGALRRGRGLDARRCLSYWSTATRAPIPQDLRPRLQARLYGCDECQLACPWNAPEARTHAAVPINLRGDGAVPPDELVRWLGLSGRALKRKLSDTALGWLSRTALLRTVCVVLGNLGHQGSAPSAQAGSPDPGPDARATVRAALQTVADGDREPSLREHARWALRRLDASKNRA